MFNLLILSQQSKSSAKQEGLEALGEICYETDLEGSEKYLYFVGHVFAFGMYCRIMQKFLVSDRSDTHYTVERFSKPQSDANTGGRKGGWRSRQTRKKDSFLTRDGTDMEV